MSNLETKQKLTKSPTGSSVRESGGKCGPEAWRKAYPAWRGLKRTERGTDKTGVHSYFSWFANDPKIGKTASSLIKRRR